MSVPVDLDFSTRPPGRHRFSNRPIWFLALFQQSRSIQILRLSWRMILDGFSAPGIGSPPNQRSSALPPEVLERSGLRLASLSSSDDLGLGRATQAYLVERSLETRQLLSRLSSASPTPSCLSDRACHMSAPSGVAFAAFAARVFSQPDESGVRVRRLRASLGRPSIGGRLTPSTPCVAWRCRLATACRRTALCGRLSRD